ncbi:hypothetical protein [Blastopirellula marina]|uniref:Uncharacterized protein n=1 Tax=Blastopirellula marina TaxID=124 RepID=A0A2S8F3V6_9BACT|nr:hypothetical protein [Blastopirellula marina]PQO26856.1 hypothetical protein C5Y98_29230 [Blastopirellula marina]PTL41063.1 hypothetical protein C5Y97_29245 [Blastopirellula marina]
MTANPEQLLQVGYPALEEALGQLKAHNQGLEQFIEELVAELGRLSDEFQRRSHEASQAAAQHAVDADAAAQSSAELAQLRETISHREQSLAAAELQLAAARAEAEQYKAQSGSSAADLVQIAEMQNRNAELERQLRDSAAAQRELEESRGEIAHLKQQLAAVKIELLDAQQQFERGVSYGEGHEEDEFVELEDELARVRSRAAELTATVDRQQREIAAERAEWSTELKSMRTLLERQSGALPTRAVAADESLSSTSVGTNTVVRETAPPRSLGTEKVVDSVLAQFAKLQRDINRRRTNGQNR